MSMLSHFFDFKPEVLALDEKAMELCQPYFRHMEEIRDYNQLKMLKAFADTQMSSTDMLGTTGYGLWDTGRAKLEQIFAEVMGAEDALVRSQFQSGTHTLAVALFGLLRAGDTLLAATGRPYDTLEGVIGLDGKGKGTGTLMDYGVKYDEAPLKADFTPDYDLIAQKAPGAKVCHIQRSRGYLQRNAFDLDTIRKIADTARAANPEIIIFVDNCYGEFTQTEAVDEGAGGFPPQEQAAGRPVVKVEGPAGKGGLGGQTVGAARGVEELLIAGHGTGQRQLGNKVLVRTVQAEHQRQRAAGGDPQCAFRHLPGQHFGAVLKGREFHRVGGIGVGPEHPPEREDEVLGGDGVLGGGALGGGVGQAVLQIKGVGPAVGGLFPPLAEGRLDFAVRVLSDKAAV